jgi:hypothetical protein
MNLHSIIFGIAGLMALIVVPVYIHHLYKKQKERKFLMHFKNLAEREKLEITQNKMWKDKYLIGLDDKANKIIYLNKIKEKIQEYIIDLHSVDNCRIASQNRNVKTADGTRNVTDRLELVFTYRAPDAPQTVLEFYDSEVFLTSDEEHPLIENWLRIINSRLKNTRR